MRNRILWINPIGTDCLNAPLTEYLLGFCAPHTDLEVVSLEKGPSHLNYSFHEALVVPEILRRVRCTEQEAYDGVIVGCFNDTGVWESREIAAIPVMGPGEAAHHLASLLGWRWRVLVSQDKCIPKMAGLAGRLGFWPERASFQAVETEVHDFHEDDQLTYRRLLDAGRLAVDQDLIEVIVLGCTVLYGYYDRLQQELGVPVIDSAVAALKGMESLLEVRRLTKWSFSKRLTYAGPAADEAERTVLS